MEGSKIRVLCPKLDKKGILRSDTRLEHAEFLNFNSKYPIILPKRHRVTELIIKEYHEKGNHTRGTNATLSDIHQNFGSYQQEKKFVDGNLCAIDAKKHMQNQQHKSWRHCRYKGSTIL